MGVLAWPAEAGEGKGAPLGAHPRSLVDDVQRRPTLLLSHGRSRHTQRDLGALGRHVDGVGDEVVEDLLQIAGRREGEGPRASLDQEVHLPFLGQGHPRGAASSDDGPDVDRLACRGPVLGPGQHQQPVHEARQTMDLGHRRFEVLVGALGYVAFEHLQAQAQGGERCA